MFKKIVLALGFLIAMMGAGVAFFSANLPATHATLAKSDLPPLIPVGSFYADRGATWGYLPSSGGRYYSHYGTIWIDDVLFVRDTATGEKLFHLEDIDYAEWSDSPDILHVWRDRRVWAVNVTNADEDTWTDITPRGFQSWQYVSPPNYALDRRWVLTWDRAGSYADLWAVDMNGRNRTLVEENDGQVLNWIGDKSLDMKLRVKWHDDTTTRVEVPQDGDWRRLMLVDAADTFSPIYLSKDNSIIYAYSSRGRDKLAIVAASTTDGTETVLAQHPDLDMGRAFSFESDLTQIDYAVTDVDETQGVAITALGQNFQDLVADLGVRADLADVNGAPDGRYFIVEVAKNAIGYQQYMFDLLDKTSTPLGTSAFFERHGDDLVTLSEVTFKARDGMDIHAFLHRPQNVDGPVPLMVLIHGGPAHNTSWKYSHWRQFLVNRGYAVLSVNFRGSTGYGKAYQAAGYRTFGRAMQHDVEDAALWAIEQGIADPKAIGVAGGSYGGYSAAMAALQRPDLFKAAIVEHAMLDVKYQSQFPPPSWGLNLYHWTKYFGDPKSEADLAIMGEYSPIKLAPTLEVPMLLIAGKRDGVVGFEQSEHFFELSADAPVPPVSYLFEDEGHGIDSWQNEITRARIVEDFLHEHLGGRSGGWDWIEIAAEYF